MCFWLRLQVSWFLACELRESSPRPYQVLKIHQTSNDMDRDSENSPTFLQLRRTSKSSEESDQAVVHIVMNITARLHIISSSEIPPKSTKRITATVEHENISGIHTEIPPGVRAQKEKCIEIIPSDIRATFLSLLLPPPQLSRIQVDSNHRHCFVSLVVLVSNVQRWASRPGRRNGEPHDWSDELSCPAVCR